MNELTIKTELAGLDKSKAKQIEAVFAPMVKMLKEFEAVYDEIAAMEINPDTCKKAKRLRLDIGRVRIDADKVRKVQKEEYLRAGNAIQGVYNILKFAVADKEEKLKDIETHYERIEADKKKRLQTEREAELLKYDVEQTGSTLTLGDMDDVVWDNYLAGTKANHEAVVAAEKKAEEERVEAEQKEAEAREKMRLENEQLRKEAAEATRVKAEADREAEEERQAREAKIQEEREAREKLEKEITDREAVAAQKAEAEKKAQLAPDKEKLNIIAADLLTKKETLISDDAKDAIETASAIILAIAERM